MESRKFEREFLRLAFTTGVELSPPSLAFLTSVPIAEAENHLRKLVDAGTLELGSDDDGHLKYVMPDRPAEPMQLDHPALVGHRQISTHLLAESTDAAHGRVRAVVVRRMVPARWEPARPTVAQAVGSIFLNGLICPGVGSMVGGRTGTGLAQAALFALGLPLALFAVGVPMMAVAWIWGLVTSAQLMRDARD